MKISPYTGAGDKRYTATFTDNTKVHFGQKNPKYGTYIDHKDKDKRAAYIARHSKNGEDWNNPKTAGALSRFLLWGGSTSLRTNVASYKRKFNL